MIQFPFTQTHMRACMVACTRSCTHTASPYRLWVLQTSFLAMWAPATHSPLLWQNGCSSSTCAAPAAHWPMCRWGSLLQGPTGIPWHGVPPLCPPPWWPTVGCRHPAARLLCPSQQHSGLVFYTQHFCVSLLYFNEGPAVNTDFTKKEWAPSWFKKKTAFHLSQILLR